MCGIVAWISQNGIKKDDILLSGINTLTRGYDGSGVWTIEKGGAKGGGDFGKNFHIYKEKLPNYSNLGLLHDRKKSVGKIVDINSHPFAFKDWVFIHNGTMNLFSYDSQYAKSAKKWVKKELKGETDSERIFLYAMYGVYFMDMKIKKALETVMKFSYGSYTFILINKKYKTLYIASNYDRYVIKNENTLFAFSTKEIADASIDLRNFMEIKLSDDILYEISLDDFTFMSRGKINETWNSKNFYV